MIADPSRYEPRANDTVLDFARHYGTSMLPARPYSPKDKAKAESAVQIVERWIMARLRHQRFETIYEVNSAILPLLKQLNERAFQKLPGSRASTFAEIDVPALQPLPMQRYEIAHFKTVTVHIDYHIEVDKHRYSVPHAWVGQVLEARITASTVEILHRGQRIASHAYNSRPSDFSTVKEHMPAAHRAHMEWSPQRLIDWGKTIGPATAVAVTRLLEERKHPEHGYRACLGLLSLAKRYGKPRLEAGCTLALQIGACQYRHVRDILANNRDKNTPTTTTEWVSPNHAYVRGPRLLPIRNTEMMMHTTLAQLRTLKLDGLATGLEEQLTLPAMASMSFEERLALLVDREIHCRNDRRLLRLLKNAHLKFGQATIGRRRHTTGTRGRSPRGDESGAGRLGHVRAQRPDHRKNRSGQILAGLRLGAICVPSRVLCALPTRSPSAGRTAHPAWQRRLRQVATTACQNRCPTTGRLGHRNDRQHDPIRPAGNH